MKIAIVHDWLYVYGGAERVLEQMLAEFPDADLYTLIDNVPLDQRHFLGDRHVYTSFLQRAPLAKSKHRLYLGLMPHAVEQFDLSAYDLVISSSSAMAKGVITGPDQLHICMCYSPMRYAWDLQHEYLKASGLNRGFKGLLAKWFLHHLRIWDVRTANGVDAYIAISDFIRRRIRKVYRRESTTIYPPVYIDDFEVNFERGDYYVTASRLVPYKRIDLIVAAFNTMPTRKLVVVGDGPEFKRLKDLASDNIVLLGYQSAAELHKYIRNARAFIFAAEEDFGIAPVEAQACGTPVIAYGKGGALETIQGIDTESPTGVFFNQQNTQSLKNAVDLFEDQEDVFAPEMSRINAERFSTTRFRTDFRSFVSKEWESHCNVICNND